MKRLWAPWRLEFVSKATRKMDECIFCDLPREDNDESNYIAKRGRSSYVILNSYPYNNGHSMVAPYKHVRNLEDLTNQELLEHFDMVRDVIKALKKIYRPKAFNIGMNLGRSAGAGIADHIHSHIVPRWDGDTNYMPVISDTKIVHESLSSTYKKLSKTLK
ncbi:MAG: HIT domain-containing protein [Nitrososphaerales archaeon]